MAKREAKPLSAQPKCCHGPGPKVRVPSRVCWEKAVVERTQVLLEANCKGSWPLAGAGTELEPSHDPQVHEEGERAASKSLARAGARRSSPPKLLLTVRPV